MKNNSAIRIFIIFTFLLLGMMFQTGCNDTVDEIKILIISNGSGFSGWYDADGDITYFANDENPGGTIFTSTIKLEDIDKVETEVTTDGDAYSLTINIYRNDGKVKSSNTYSSDGDTLYLSLTYTLGEEDEDDDDDSSSSD